MLTESCRPTSFDSVLGLGNVIARLKEFIASPEGIPHLMFYGLQGTGKTSISKVVGREVLKDNFNADFYEFNASKDRGIDFVRNEVADIAKRRSVSSKYKIILMDEADNITPDAQACFRGIIEQYHKNTRFIFTCNYPGKLIGPILSRFTKFEFTKPEMKDLEKYLTDVAAKNNISVTPEKIHMFAKNANGDIRNALGMLEGNTVNANDGKWNGITISKIKTMQQNDKIDLAFAGDADAIFGQLWDLVKVERAWSLLPLLCDCNSKMNLSVHKNMFLAKLLDSIK